MRAKKLRLNLDKAEVLLVQKSIMELLEYCPALKGGEGELKEQVHSRVCVCAWIKQLLLDSQARNPWQPWLGRAFHLDHAGLASYLCHSDINIRLL